MRQRRCHSFEGGAEVREELLPLFICGFEELRHGRQLLRLHRFLPADSSGKIWTDCLTLTDLFAENDECSFQIGSAMNGESGGRVPKDLSS